jgi:solute carrier family 31 (copper transporter), member 1
LTGLESHQCPLFVQRNTQIINTCVVFPQWHISSNTSFFISFLIIVALGVAYEYLRELQKSLDIRIATALVAANGKGRSRTPGSGRSTPDHEAEESALLGQSKKARAWCVAGHVDGGASSG